MPLKTALTLFLAATLMGCATSDNEYTPSAPQSITSPILRDDALNDYWVVNQKFAPDYPTSAVHKGHEGCVTVGYYIEADGTTSGNWVIASYPKFVFERSALNASLKTTYTPGPLNEERQSVVTTMTFTYKLASGNLMPSQLTRELMEKQCTDPAEKVLKEKYGSSVNI